MSLDCRPARIEDGDAILALMPRLAAFEIPTTRVAEHLWMHDEALFRQWLAGQADEVLVSVVEDEDKEILGFAMASLLTRRHSAKRHNVCS